MRQAARLCDDQARLETRITNRVLPADQARDWSNWQGKICCGGDHTRSGSTVRAHDTMTCKLSKAKLVVARNTNTASRRNSYRAEIDGLRALAVTAVIINHFSSDVLPSGYLGVDIFFVISGFVITSSLAAHNCHSFGDLITTFYVRRIKRVVPALLFFVLMGSILICLLTPNPIFSLKTGFASVFGVLKFIPSLQID